MPEIEDPIVTAARERRDPPWLEPALDPPASADARFRLLLGVAMLLFIALFILALRS